MALELRPSCEHCDVDLPPSSRDAMICTYECTFCAACVRDVLRNVCPNCGGGFERRPIRPVTAWRPGVSLAHQPAGTRRRHRPVDPAGFDQLRDRLADVDPAAR